MLNFLFGFFTAFMDHLLLSAALYASHYVVLLLV